MWAVIAIATGSIAWATPGEVHLASMAEPAVPPVPAAQPLPPHAFVDGVGAFERGDVEAALALLRQAGIEEAGSIRAQRALAFALALDGRLAEAEALWLSMASSDPTDSTALRSLGTVRAMRRDHEGAARVFERLVRVDPTRDNWSSLGRCRAAAGDTAGALLAYREAQALGCATACTDAIAALTER